MSKAKLYLSLLISVALGLFFNMNVFAGDAPDQKREKLTQHKICTALLPNRLHTGFELLKPDTDRQSGIPLGEDSKRKILRNMQRTNFNQCYAKDSRNFPGENGVGPDIEISFLFSEEAIAELASVEYKKEHIPDVANAFIDSLNELFQIHEIAARGKLIRTEGFTRPKFAHFEFTNLTTKKSEFSYRILLEDTISRHSELNGFHIKSDNKPTGSEKTKIIDDLSDYIVLVVGSGAENNTLECGRSQASVYFDSDGFGVVNSSHSVAVVNLKCICSQNTLVHEIGHLMGVNHALSKEKPKFRRGHFISGMKWGSTMSTVKECKGCIRGNFWSDPSFKFQIPGNDCDNGSGKTCALGTNENNAVRQLRNAAVCAASINQFRGKRFQMIQEEEEQEHK